MGYGIWGWMEAASATGEWVTHSELPDLRPGPVSEHLFGLARSISADGPLHNRGLPNDASPTVQRAIDRLLAFKMEHPDEPIDTTWCFYDEAKAEYARFAHDELFTIYFEVDGWEKLFELADAASRNLSGGGRSVRFVLFGEG